MTLDEIHHELGSILSMAPAPWSFSRSRLEDANGNEVAPADIVAYLNMTFEKLPKLLKVAEAASALIDLEAER